jgi:Cd2+/Zn2+-exporting ATPase
MSVPLTEATYRWTTLRIPEMDCPQELGLIEQGLASLGGIEQLRADYLNRSLRVLYDPDLVDPEQIRGRLSEIGFPTHLGPVRDSDPLEDRPWRGVLVTWFQAPDCWLATIALSVAVAARLLGWSTLWVAGAASAAVLLAGPPIAALAWRALRLHKLDMHTLMTLAAAGALLTGEWLEAASVTVLFRLSLLIEQASQRRARRAIEALVNMTPQVAHRLDGDQGARWTDVPLDALQVEDRVLVRPGEQIPTDGWVVDGASSINEALITGESLPVEKVQGDPVYAGSICGEGTLQIRVSRPARDSTLARISRLIEQARSEPSPSERLVDRFAAIYTPGVIGFALLISVLPPLAAWILPGWYMTSQSWEQLAHSWFLRALVLLVIACPCALVISTPVTIVCGLYRASRLGALIKGGTFLEQLGRLRCLAFDKTGTLTAGKPHVIAVEPLADLSSAQILRLAAALETKSEHPLARAIVQAAPDDRLECQQFRVLRGFGVQANVAQVTYTLASPRYFLDQGLLSTEQVDGFQSHHTGASLALLTRDNSKVQPQLLGAIYLRDDPREDTASAVRQLRQLGVRHQVMLTGDHRPTAEYVSQLIGLDEFHADLLPDDKIAHVKQLAQQEPRMAMVGDGVNDAPALAAAPLGIALGTAASDVALETADVAIMAPHLERVADLMRLSNWVRQVLIQNIAAAIGIKLFVLLLALFGFATMWMAVAADVGASLLVIANGTRILHGTLPKH